MRVRQSPFSSYTAELLKISCSVFFTERANIVTYTIKSHVLRSVTSNTYWNIKYSTSVFIINPTISIFSAFHFSKKKTQMFAVFHITIKSNKKGR